MPNKAKQTDRIVTLTRLKEVKGAAMTAEKMATGTVTVRFSIDDDTETLTLQFGGAMIMARYKDIEQLVKETRKERKNGKNDKAAN